MKVAGVTVIGQMLILEEGVIPGDSGDAILIPSPAQPKAVSIPAMPFPESRVAYPISGPNCGLRPLDAPIGRGRSG